MRSIVIHHAMNKFRDFFLRWKLETERVKVIEFNEDEGPVRMEVRELNQTLFNLKELLRGEGFPEERINQIVKNAETSRM